MARSEAHAIKAVHPGLPGQADRGERRLRRIGAWLALFFLVQGELGAVWDREWHAFVGRDQFWTPPHTLIYSCIAGAGLVALPSCCWIPRAIAGVWRGWMIPRLSPSLACFMLPWALSLPDLAVSSS